MTTIYTESFRSRKKRDARYYQLRTAGARAKRGVNRDRSKRVISYFIKIRGDESAG